MFWLTLMACAGPKSTPTDTGATAPTSTDSGGTFPSGSGVATYTLPTGHTGHTGHTGGQQTDTGPTDTGSSPTAATGRPADSSVFDSGPRHTWSQLDQGRPADPADCFDLYSAANGYLVAPNAKAVQGDCAAHGLVCDEPFITFETALCLTDVGPAASAVGFLRIVDIDQPYFDAYYKGIEDSGRPGPYAAVWTVSWWHYGHPSSIGDEGGTVYIDALTGAQRGESYWQAY